MRPLVWNPPVELSAKEEKVAKRIRFAKLFVFLRQIRTTCWVTHTRIALEVIAQNYQQDLADVAANVGADIVTGTSLKAALDLDWDEPESRNLALSRILQALNSVESWVEQKTNLDFKTSNQVNKSLKDARHL